jgi:hypothetical protein
MWAPTGLDESVVQPAANEGEVPSLAAGSSLWETKRRRGVGWWWCFTPLFATESESKCEKADLQAPPPLRLSLFAGVPITAALGTIRITLP